MSEIGAPGAFSGHEAVAIREECPRPGQYVAWIIIHGRHGLNIVGSAELRALAESLQALGKKKEYRALVLRGAGERAFIGGADISEMAALTPQSAREFISLIHICCEAIRNASMPVIARLNGYTLGAGLEIAAACDLRIAADSATFGMPEVKIGIPSVVEAALLPSLVGWGRAREILLWGRNFSASEALAWGFVQRMVPESTLDQALSQAIDELLSTAPAAVHQQKALMRRWEELPLNAAIAAGIDAFVAAYETEEPRTYMHAWQTKRKRS
jgi:enoyl-CoA hydratase